MSYGHCKALCRRQGTVHGERYKSIKDNEGRRLAPCIKDLRNWSWNNRMSPVVIVLTLHFMIYKVCFFKVVRMCVIYVVFMINI